MVSKKLLFLITAVIVCLIAGTVSASKVSDVELFYDNGLTTAKIKVEGTVRFTHQTEVAKDNKPYRVIVDVLSGTHNLGGHKFVSLPNCPVKAIRSSQYAVNPEAIVRIVFDMDAERVYRIDTKENYDTLSYELWQSIAKYSELKFDWFWLLNEDKILKWKVEWTNNNFYDYITTNLNLHLNFLFDNKVIDNYLLIKVINIFQNNKNVINNCESCLIHHDLADHNLIYDTDSKWLWAIFDWEAMVLGDPMLDLWSCPTWETHYERKEILIEWYKSIKKLPEDYKLRMNLYELRTLIWKIMFSIRMNFDKKVIEKRIFNMKSVINKF